MAGKLTRREFMVAPVIRGLAAARPAPRSTVLIAGAGLAGLSAAHELTRAGCDVVVIEARSRVGGRVLTLRSPFDEGLYAEAGPVAFSERHPLVLEYAKRLGISIQPILPRDMPVRYFLGGKRLTVRENGVADWPVGVTAEERRVGLYGMVERYTGAGVRALGDPTAQGWPTREHIKLDRLSFGQYLSRQGASAAAIALLRPMYEMWGDGIDHVSALFLLRDSSIGMVGERWFTFSGGNDALPEALGRTLSAKILLNTPIARIQQNHKAVEVTVTRNGQTEKLEAEYLVCTIPFPVLRGIEVSPSFSVAKRRAIAELPYTSVARVYLQASSRFWLDGGPRGWTYTDLPIMNVLESTWNQPGKRGIMHAYMAGVRARAVTRMTELERIQFTLTHMEKLYPGMRAHFETGATKCWDEDPWSKGDYPWFRVGQMETLLPGIARPEGRIHFAGDQTSPWCGWMQGALESGRRAAKEILRA